MKKFLSILALVLVVAMCASFAVSAADATIQAVSGSNTATSDATLTYKAATESQTVYSVDVTWTDLAFDYDAGTKTWSPTKHEDEVSGAGWKDDEGSVTVANHSNKAVAVAVAFETANNGSATVSADEASFTLATGVGKTFATADSKVVGLTATGVPESSAKLGTIKVTVTAAN